MTIADKIARTRYDLSYMHFLGLERGYSNGYTEGFDEGKTDRENYWWDTFQNKGNRVGYHGAFASFPSELFYPKHDIVLGTIENADFRTFPVSSGSRPESEALDLAERMEMCYVRLDTSRVVSCQHLFYFAAVTRIPTLDLSNLTSALYELFYYCIYLHTIDKIKLSDSGTQIFANTFDECRKLQNITFEGKIGRSISFLWSPLTLESAKSVINALVDYYGTESANLYTVTFSETTKGYLDAAGAVFSNNTTWREYVASIGWNA